MANLSSHGVLLVAAGSILWGPAALQGNTFCRDRAYLRNG